MDSATSPSTGRKRFPAAAPEAACAGAGVMQRWFDQGPDAVFLVEMSGRIVEANPAACRLLECSKKELLPLRPWHFIVGVSRTEIQEWMRCLARGEAAALSLVWRSRAGRRRRVEASVVRLEDDRFVASCRELAVDPRRLPAGAAQNSPARRLRQYRRRLLQLQRHNQSLVEAEHRLRLAMELGRVGLWVWNATDTTNPGHWSDRLKEIFGLPLDAEVTHDMFLKCVHPDDRSLIDSAVRAAIEGKNGGSYSTEYRTVPPGGGNAERWVLARGQAFFDGAGAVVRFIGTVMDITERKRAEAALERLNTELEDRIAERTAELERTNRSLTLENAERQRVETALQRNKNNLRLVIDTIPGLVWSSLPDGHIDYLNQRWLDYTGLTLEQASGWGWQTAIHPDDLGGLLSYWKSILEAGTAGETEARLRRHDGAYRWFLFRGVPLFDEAGALVKWYGTNTDVEERRTSEHLARGQAEALSQTLTAIAQEPDSEKVLQHVLRTIGDRLGAHSIAVWELNAAAGCVELVASCEGDRLHLVAQGGLLATPRVPLGAGEHPVWTEFFRTGTHCVAGEITEGGARVRVLDGTESPWFDWFADIVASPKVPVLLDRLSTVGVSATLSVPMFVAGKVTGFLSIRFQQRPQFRCEEIELARVLAHQAMLALQLMRLSGQSRHTAVIAERNRMARELHDTLAQGFTGIIVQLEATEDAWSRGLEEAAGQHLKRARELARTSLREARRSVRAMRPQALKDHDLCGALAALFKDMTEGTGMQAELVLRGTPWRLRPRCEENLLRVGQEVLTNALRHARATRFAARMTFSAREVRLQLHDNGRGFDPLRCNDGFGLTGIRERVEAMGGRLVIRSAPGKGASVGIRLPLEEVFLEPEP